jgi:hypothetical protein
MQTAHKEKKGDSSFLLFSSAVSDDTRGCEKKSFVSVKKERKKVAAAMSWLFGSRVTR